MPDTMTHFSVSSLYLIGGLLNYCSHSKGCYKYDINNNKWTKIADLNIDRSESACVVFKGKIVATEGYN